MVKRKFFSAFQPYPETMVDTDWYQRLGSLYAVDDMVKAVYDWLLKNNQLDNSMIVFVSDNGYNLGAMA